MKEFKGTPGPWSLNGYEYDMGRHVYSIQGGNHTVTMPDGTKHPATIGMIRFKGVYGHNVVIDENGQSDMINQSAVPHLENANLIAAAPELLDVLQDLWQHYERHGQILTWNVSKAREAIEKAIGA